MWDFIKNLFCSNPQVPVEQRRAFLASCVAMAATPYIPKVTYFLPEPKLLLPPKTLWMTKAEWMELDLAVMRAARLRMRAWADLYQSNTLIMDHV